MNDDELAPTREPFYEEALARFPKPGSKLRFRGASDHFWFTEMITDARSELRVGQLYTLKTITLASSWACITLEETGDHKFSLGFFDRL